MDTSKKGKYLGFLEELMAYTKTTKADIARGLGTSWQNVQLKFTSGDMKMSKAEEIAAIMGYDIQFVLDDGAHVMSEGTVQKNVGGLLLQINDLMPQSKRLDPLQVFLRLHGKTTKQVAEDIGITPGSMSKYFRDDDMHISRLFWIAEAYGWKVQIKIDKKKD